MSLISDLLNGHDKKRTSKTPDRMHIPPKLMEIAQTPTDAVLSRFGTASTGLTGDEIEQRIRLYGLNEIAREKHQSAFIRLLIIMKNPLIILLGVLAIISFTTGDPRSTTMISLMIALSVILRFFQEANADKAAEKLKAMVTTTATVIREGGKREIPLKEIVPGDIITLSVGDMVPADIRLLSIKDLFVNQATLTGEALPVEKAPSVPAGAILNPLEMPNICFMGSNVTSGVGTGVAVLTGNDTFLGSLASSIVGKRELTSFDRGVNSFTWLMISFMLVLSPLVFLINGITKNDWLGSFLFALSVAIGLTPEMLPMIVTVCLSKGALSMSRKKVIVKRLSAIQDFGAMDVLCTDKTGTITLGRIVLEKHLDIYGRENEAVLEYAYLNSFYQTGLKNLLDVAVLKHADLEKRLIGENKYRKIDEIPFDFVRRCMSVIVEDTEKRHILVCKGATEEIIGLCTKVEIRNQEIPLTTEHLNEAKNLVQSLNSDGFRVIALAYRVILNQNDTANYAVQDEVNLTLRGFLAFYDPPKETAAEAIRRLNKNGIDVKILTGDSELVTMTICGDVGLNIKNVLLGSAIEKMSDTELAGVVDNITVFAKLSPAHKERIVRALKQNGHVVGFMGDGINDAPALRAADVGISVDSAVDIAKESSSIILLESNLLVLDEGVIEGRQVFGNIIKYVRMAASSNFGNMFSVIGASIFVPFIPMLPIQVLTNNMLYDFSQTSIPTDKVDTEWLAKPRQWAITDIRRYIMVIGPISSIFDIMTYVIMLFVFNCWGNPELFHTGWFVESLFTQTLIIHVIRTNKIPFIQSRASWPLLLTSLLIIAIGGWLPFSPLADTLGFVPLPPLYWLLLLGMLIAYVILTQLIKTWYIHRWEK
jgi:Mg2+-importing ATPase